MGWHSGFPTGRPWVFASSASHPGQGLGRLAGVTSRSRTLFLGSCAFTDRYRSAHAHWVRRDTVRGSLSPRCVTSLAATITRIANWALSRPSIGWPCRWPPAPPCPLLLASHGFVLRRTGLRIRSLFHFRRSLPCPTTRGNISGQVTFPERNFDALFRISTAHVQILCDPNLGRCITWWIN